MTATHTSRRSLLKGAAMLSVLPVAASVGAAPLFDAVGEPEPVTRVTTETPILRLFCQWEALLDEQDAAHDAAPGQSVEASDAMDALFDERRHEIEAAMLAEPPTDLRDLAVKVLVNSGEGCFGLDDVLTLECAAIVGRDFDKLPRCLFEKRAEAA